jgi:hypothetical protein
MSLYRITINDKDKYVYSKRPALFYKLRRYAIHAVSNRSTFIHELQAEPWLRTRITNVPVEEQLRYMNPKILNDMIEFARNTGADPIDLWGLEWWYWLKHKHNNDSLWSTIQKLVLI